MRILNLDKKTADGLARVSAEVVWETCDQPSREIYIETTADFAEALAPLPDAFLIAALIPALHFGEQRIAIAGGICPRLKEGLTTVMSLMQVWSNGEMKPLQLEVDTLAAPRFAGDPRRAGLFLSGGIDSLAALRLNRLHYGPGHPGAVQDGLMVHGFDIGGVMVRGMKYHVFDRARQHMAPVAEEAGLTLIPVYTNIRHLCDNRELWLNRFFGAVLGAVAQAFAPRLHRVEIAASYDLANLVPCGSHPMLDPEYSSFDVQVRHRDAEWSRLDKLRLIAEWEVALHHLRVCLANVPDRLNCGRCEKCVRTMTGLLAIQALDKSRAFVEKQVTPEMFDAFRINIRHREPFYEELLEPLKAVGRQDLADLIQAKLKEPPPALTA
jgi:hypothetical protein